MASSFSVLAPHLIIDFVGQIVINFCPFSLTNPLSSKLPLISASSSLLMLKVLSSDLQSVCWTLQKNSTWLNEIWLVVLLSPPIPSSMTITVFASFRTIANKSTTVTHFLTLMQMVATYHWVPTHGKFTSGYYANLLNRSTTTQTNGSQRR